ncbi:hypothetical protein [Fimbriiglobus ruber]|uniref:Uncharacterized protein n=1 Tax=Fimbriiglobus ruber TaxID=1908690 RepID=A0A225DTY8_9BACT|nr:hypothetical protein [Fimbriiglobus ruber]OWK42008.1 hypothetical protein FRUB_04086 [Fimbriiglobus ruber]
MTQSLIEYALNTLSVLYHEDQRYREANRVLRGLDTDFPVKAQAASGTILKSVVDLLDEILGDAVASYFLFEAVNMTDGGKIIETDSREWPIRSLEDVKAYVLREKVV